MTFARLSQFTIVVPFAIAIYRYKRLSVIQKLIGLICFFTLSTEGIGMIIVELFDISNNLPVYNGFALVLFFLINRIYAITSQSNRIEKRFDLLLLSFILLASINIFFIQGIDSFNSNVFSVAALIYICLVILYFIDLLRTPKHLKLERQPMFWFSTGIIIYHASTLILFLLISYVIEGSKELVRVTGGLNAVLNIILNAFYTVSLSLRVQSNQESV